MPRRISDYPDGFAGWNLVSSIGSIISVIATFVFLYIIYAQLVHGVLAGKDPWGISVPFSDILRINTNRNSDSIEWVLNSPPKVHAFVGLPVRSSLPGFRGLIKSVVGVSLGALTFDSWRIAKMEQKRVNHQSGLEAEINKLTNINYDKDIENNILKTKIEATTGRIQESQIEIGNLVKKSKSLVDQLKQSNLDSDKKVELTGDLSRTMERKSELLSRVADEVKSINDTFATKSMIGDDWFNITIFREFLSSLSAEQLGCLFNVIGLSLILVIINSIILIYFGNKIIEYMDLESKYPKLARFIKIRRKLIDKYIKFQTIYIYVLCIIWISVNVYMFFL